MNLHPLILPGYLEALKALSTYILLAAAQASLDEEATYRLRLAVDEIATNAILHGYQRAGQDGEIRVQAEIKERQLLITLEDDGPAYNPLDTPPPQDLKQPPQQTCIGGLGVYLARQLVDDFQYERDGKTNRNYFLMDQAGRGEGKEQES